MLGWRMPRVDLTVLLVALIIIGIAVSAFFGWLPGMDKPAAEYMNGSVGLLLFVRRPTRLRS